MSGASGTARQQHNPIYLRKFLVFRQTYKQSIQTPINEKLTQSSQGNSCRQYILHLGQLKILRSAVSKLLALISSGIRCFSELVADFNALATFNTQ